MNFQGFLRLQIRWTNLSFGCLETNCFNIVWFYVEEADNIGNTKGNVSTTKKKLIKTLEADLQKTLKNAMEKMRNVLMKYKVILVVEMACCCVKKGVYNFAYVIEKSKKAGFYYII